MTAPEQWSRFTSEPDDLQDLTDEYEEEELAAMSEAADAEFASMEEADRSILKADLEVSAPGIVTALRSSPTPQPVYKAEQGDRGLVTGWASVITNPDGSPVVDNEGDQIEEEDLELAAHEFMQQSRLARDHHQGPAVGEVVESLVLTQATKKALGLEAFPSGWLVTVKVHDPAVWARVKAGELGAFSVGGTAVREPLILKANPTPEDAHLTGISYGWRKVRGRLAARRRKLWRGRGLAG